jgi:hypothetical protein
MNVEDRLLIYITIGRKLKVLLFKNLIIQLYDHTVSIPYSHPRIAPASCIHTLSFRITLIKINMMAVACGNRRHTID